jgi:putative tricarboxylic transport membrane protein
MTPSRGAQALGVGIALVGLVFVVTAFWLPGDETYARVGPGSGPALVGIGLIVAGMVFARAAARGEVPSPPPPRRTSLAWIVGGFALATACLPRAGFPVAAGLLFAMTARAFGARRWLRGVLIGLALGLAIYALFAYALGVSLPGG